MMQDNSPFVSWLTPTEAARFLGVSRSKLYEMIRSHAIPAASLPGRGYRLSATSLESWLKSRECGGDSE
jgi:excisionase family DNA binding protein